MNFQQSLEQEMLRSSVAATFARHAHVDDAAALADLGIFGLLVGERNGGLGLGIAEAAIVLEEAGRACRGDGLAETLLLADAMTVEMPDSAAPEERIAVLAPFSGAVRRAGNRISGAVSIARPPEKTLVAVALEDSDEVVLLPASSFEPVARARIEAAAESCLIEIDVSAADARIVRVDGFAHRLAILRCAELLGAAGHCFQLSISYLKDRTQFGQPIGANQALKHIAADTYLSLENMRVAVEYAAAASDLSAQDAGHAEDAARAVEVMLAYVPLTAREIAETAVHLHGGIGLTWEYPLNAYLRRIVRIGTALGSPSERRLSLLDRLQRDDGAEASGRRPYAMRSSS